MEWPEAKTKADQVRDWGIQQLLEIWRRAKGKERDALLWGDEVEYLVADFDDENRKVRLSLRQAEILAELEANEKQHQGNASDLRLPTFHPEFGRFMLEATPGKPWGIGFKELLNVEPDMKRRRLLARQHMKPTESPLTLTTFPLLGLPDTLKPDFPVSGPKLRSQFVPDEIANPHIRFPTLAANIRQRRGRKVEINVPLYRDTHTPWPFTDPTVNYDLHHYPEDDDVRRGAAKPNHIYMDAMAFGMGSCCLQITFQAKNIDEGRKMYDQLSPLGPILLALTAATPIYKGMLADTDARWNQISAAVDDRTPAELGETPGRRIPKSRYASNSTYLNAGDARLRPEYHDPALVVDAALQARLEAGGMDPLLATHFAHLFIRDPLVIFAHDLHALDLAGADHFENLQSTNWQHMRFKPPPPGAPMGWRVEFRAMEIQMTDFENAAFAVFIVLVTRAVLSFDLNFYLPIARTTENMHTAHARDAVNHARFWFRRDPMPRAGVALGAVEDEYAALSVDEIVNGARDGREDAFPGLIPLVEAYLSSMNVDVETRCELARYLDLVRQRASGAYWTGARWIRHFVDAHPEYRHDSMVGSGVAYDLCKRVERIACSEAEGRKEGWPVEMFGPMSK